MIVNALARHETKYSNSIFFVFLPSDFLQMVISQCMVYQVPPQSFQLPCVPPEETSDFPLSAGVAENPPSLNEEHATMKVNITALMDEDNLLCCQWSHTHINCVVYTAEMESKAFIYSDTTVVTSQQIGMPGEGIFNGSQNCAQNCGGGKFV